MLFVKVDEEIRTVSSSCIAELKRYTMGHTDYSSLKKKILSDKNTDKRQKYAHNLGYVDIDAMENTKSREPIINGSYFKHFFE